jgi:hypothetical protein
MCVAEPEVISFGFHIAYTTPGRAELKFGKTAAVRERDIRVITNLLTPTPSFARSIHMGSFGWITGEQQPRRFQRWSGVAGVETQVR